MLLRMKILKVGKGGELKKRY